MIQSGPMALFVRLSLQRLATCGWLLAAFCLHNSGHAQTTRTPEKLSLGQPRADALMGGETAIFELRLAAGDFVRLSVAQHGIDVELRLVAPTGQTQVLMDTLNSTQGSEVAGLLAMQTGTYQARVSSSKKEVPPGRFEIKVETSRPANSSDQQWLAAQNAYLEGMQLRVRPKDDERLLALQKFTDALRTWRVLEDQLMVAHTLYYLANGYRRLGQLQHALVYYSYALDLAHGHPDWREEPPTLVNLASVLQELGEFRKAAEYYERALAQWRNLQDSYGETLVLPNLGLAYLSLGEGRLALQYYEQSLAVWQRLKNQERIADSLAGLGFAYNTLGGWQQALEYSTEALQLYRKLAQQRGEATTLNLLGLTYLNLGETPQASEHFEQALALWRAQSNRQQEANLLANLGLAEMKRTNLIKASAAFQQALPLMRQAGDRSGEARILQRLGELQVVSAEPQKALDYYNQALPLIRNAGDRLREAEVLTSLGNLALAQNALPTAQTHFQQALTILQDIGNRAGEAQALYGLARTAQQTGQLAAALQYSETALSKIEAGRASVESQQLRASYLATAQKFYELHIDLLMQQHRTEPGASADARALQTSERMRARSLLEELTEARADIRRGVDAALLARERELQQALNAKGQRQLQLTSQSGGDTQRPQLQREINALEDELRQVQVKIRQQSPRYAALTQPQPLALPEIQHLLNGEAVLLEYALGSTRSYLWAVTKDSLSSYELPPQAQIAQAVTTLNQLLTERSRRQPGETPAQQRARFAQADAQLPTAAQTLSQMILAPLADKLQGAWANRPLLIVADGALQYVPFAALPVSKDEGGRMKDETANVRLHPPSLTLHPLLLEHEIITLPSASTLGVLRKELAGRPPAPKLLAVLADPVFSRQDALSRNTRGQAANAAARHLSHEDEATTYKLGRFLAPRLPFTRQEAERIYALVPSGEKFKALDFQASRATALSPELGQYRYLHFATHGFLDSERPRLSALVLSLVDEKGETQDGFLRAHEIYNLNLPAELVVLSACQTGLGKEIKGEGLVGLTRGFMYAGAARVLVSLWNVNDRATAELMVRFYQQMLKGGQRPAAALRTAQLELWRQKQWQAPYYWAGFVLQGEWR